jgi:hypothetical protein
LLYDTHYALIGNTARARRLISGLIKQEKQERFLAADQRLRGVLRKTDRVLGDIIRE